MPTAPSSSSPPAPADPAAAAPAHRVGALVRRWRRHRGLSQAALAEHTGISVRHLSFIETGRTLPSRDVLDWLGEALEVPGDERHAILEAAGYFAGYDPLAADPTDLDAVRTQGQRIVDGLNPCPAMVHDVLGTLFAWNHAFAALVSRHVDLADFQGRHGGHALLAALQPHLANGLELLGHYLRRVYDEMLRGKGALSTDLERLLTRLRDELGHPEAEESALDRREALPLLTRVTFSAAASPSAAGGHALDFDAFTTTLGTPPRASLRTLRMVTWLPRDAATRVAVAALCEGSGP